MVSVIIPALNEESVIESALASLQHNNCNVEILIVDGGGEDRTCEIAQKYGRVIRSKPGRGPQMNAGAANAHGEILLFLHADCQLESGAIDAMEIAMQDDSVIGGCFQQQIDAEGAGYRMIELMIQLRGSHRRCMYGDQCMFIRRAVFDAIGGFPPIPLMEDVVLSKKMHSYGDTCQVSKNVITSARRWEKMGALRTTVTNWYLRMLYECGTPPDRLAEIYYGSEQ